MMLTWLHFLSIDCFLANYAVKAQLFGHRSYSVRRGCETSSLDFTDFQLTYDKIAMIRVKRINIYQVCHAYSFTCELSIVLFCLTRLVFQVCK